MKKPWTELLLGELPPLLVVEVDTRVLYVVQDWTHATFSSLCPSRGKLNSVFSSSDGFLTIVFSLFTNTVFSLTITFSDLQS